MNLVSKYVLFNVKTYLSLYSLTKEKRSNRKLTLNIFFWQKFEIRQKKRKICKHVKSCEKQYLKAKLILKKGTEHNEWIDELILSLDKNSMVSTLCYTDLFNENTLPREGGGVLRYSPQGVYVQYGRWCNDRTQMSRPLILVK